jgi:hypothetical protein
MTNSPFSKKDLIVVGASISLVFSVFFLAFIYRRPLQDFARYAYTIGNPTFPTPTPTPIFNHVDKFFTPAQVNTFINSQLNAYMPITDTVISFPSDSYVKFSAKIKTDWFFDQIFTDGGTKDPPFLYKLLGGFPAISAVRGLAQVSYTNGQTYINVKELTVGSIPFDWKKVGINERLTNYLHGGFLNGRSDIVAESITIEKGKLHFVGRTAPGFSLLPTPVK